MLKNKELIVPNVKPIKEITGNRYGRLIVVKFLGVRSGWGAIFECLCICGNVTVIRGTYLRSGHTRSCGCLAHEQTSQRSFLDRTGKRYGQLVCIRLVLKTDKKRINLWECKCDCGNFIIVRSTNLKNGHTRSCGCLNTQKRKERRKYPYKCTKWLANIKHKYNLSPMDWTKLVLRSNGLCEICEEQFKDAKSTCIDHDHKTGKVRGLLCMICNLGLVLVEDKNKLKQAHSYIYKYGSK